MGVVGNLLRFSFKLGFVVAVIFFCPGLSPEGDYEAYTFPPVAAFEGPLHPKDFALNRAEKLFENQVVGPEAIVESPGEQGAFYSTLQGGAVVKFTENGMSMKPIAKFGEKCGGLWDARKCGRPLGASFDHNGQLIVADCYYGLFRVNPETGESTTLVYKDNEVEGKVAKIFNSVAPLKNGKIYYTVSSTNYYLDEAIGELLGPPSGRLLVYDSDKNASSVLQERIHFANGIVISPGEDFVIFAECLQFRLLKHWIQGPKKGTTETFVENLPGMPDNLNLSPKGNILVGLVTVRLPNEFNLIEFMYRHPWLRKLGLRLLNLIKLPFDLSDKYLSLPIARQIAYHILNFESFKIPPYSLILEVDWEGRIVQSWHSNLADLSRFSDAKIIDGYMYLGSPYNKYLGRLKMEG